MVQQEGGQVPACVPPGNDDRSQDAPIGGMGRKPIEGTPQLRCDLSKGGFRSQCVARQRRRPAAGKDPFGKAREDLFAPALPVPAMDVDEAWSVGVACWIEI